MKIFELPWKKKKKKMKKKKKKSRFRDKSQSIPRFRDQIKRFEDPSGKPVSDK